MTPPRWSLVKLAVCSVYGLLAACGDGVIATQRDAPTLEQTRDDLLESAPAPHPTPNVTMTPAALARVRRSLTRSPDNLLMHTRPDGLHDVEVRSGFRHMTLMTRNADGTLTPRCTHDADEAAELLTTSTP
jgi:hypothetical protein